MKEKMFKYIFSLLLLFVVLSGNSQTINGRLYTQFNNYYKWRGGAYDSVLLLPNLTATAGLRGGALRYSGSDSSLYVWTGFQWRKIDGGGSGSTDTTSLSNRINLKLNISDTANMLFPYLRSNVAAATYQPIGDYLVSGTHGSLHSLTITGTSGSGNIHLRHQSSLPTATGQSTTIYANSNGDFAYKNDGNYHTTFVTSANTADRSYTFQNKSYTVADNAEVVKYTDTAAMLNGRISGITLNTSGAIHTTPITFNRVGGAWSGTMSLASQTANTVFAGPTTGSAATPTFRALVDADIPSTSKGVQWIGVDSAFALNSALNGYHELEDFIGVNPSVSLGGNIPGSKLGLAWTNSGTYSSTQISGVMGSVTFSTAANSQGAAGVGHFTAGLQAYSFEATADWTVFQTRVKVPTLNDGTERYFIFIGFSDASGVPFYGPTALTNAIGFYYDLSGSVTGSASTANWQTATASGSSRTFNQNYTGVAVPTDTWVTLTIKYTSSQVQFFINGTLRATHTTNIPTAFLTPHLIIRKTNGTTARTINVDYISIDKKFTR